MLKKALINSALIYWQYIENNYLSNVCGTHFSEAEFLNLMNLFKEDKLKNKTRLCSLA